MSLILGIVGFLLCWIPLIGILTIPLSGLGALLGGIGLLVAFLRKGAGIGWPLAGLAVSVLALIIGSSQIVVIDAAIDALDETAVRDIRTNQEVVQPTYDINLDSPGRTEDLIQTPDDSDQEPRETQNPHPEAPPAETPSQNEWASAKQPVRQGDVEVQVIRAAQEITQLKDIFNDASQSEEEQFSIQIRITNLSGSQKLSYKSWQGEDFSFARDYATLNDNFGNSYKRINFGATTKIVGQVKSDSIYPGKSITDLLVFEPPIDSADHLDLELPASNFGGEGMLRMRIPREMFRGPDSAQIAREQAEREAAERARRDAERARLEAEEEAKIRTWTARSGGHTTEAKLISYANGQVTLENRNDKRIKVSLDKLSDADREYVEKWKKENR